MSFSIFINKIRRRIMHGITKHIGSSGIKLEIGALNPENIKRVLIIRANHRLGNQLLLTPIVQEVLNTFPNATVDLFVKGGVANPVFQNYDRVKTIIQLPKMPFSNLIKYIKCWASIKQKTYDLVINGDKNSSSGRLLTQMARADFKLFGEVIEAVENEHPDSKHISKHPIYNLRYFLTQLGLPKNESALPLLDIKLSDSEINKGKALLNDIVKNDKKTICIYTNATGDKCYSEDWWTTLYNRLLEAYSQYNIIEMLPIENISKINFKATHFYSQDIREMGAIIHNTAIFIAADNGVMHLASASLTPCVGFFSVTNPEVYEPYGNGSIALNTNKTTIEDWMQAINNILKKS
ncbi:glycosyltransferase family 9 protein [Siansivirga zeaxanthinifaciens]|uniref:ADP-heptose--LPS heptosyltransferase n=1 Tax=Siansivirga zeaxanthinifaciens CC-SAMT-1 TaxID=1454006 RepID=A0A0C5VYV9_9FLAO|nr:glycosyltransferase family 9 protein [Siansivirga zeaxanthinifaciens]AJR04216.1 ADP-heptose--LPS heptosyltransferase [Siansivirga zeaxanthinifaciens CC-SAMT-1]